MKFIHLQFKFDFYQKCKQKRLSENYQPIIFVIDLIIFFAKILYITYSWFWNFSFDPPGQNQTDVSELNIEDFLDNKNDQVFEIQQNQDQGSPKDLLVRDAQFNNQEQNQNKRRRCSAASTSNSSSSSNNSTSSLITTSIKTDFGGLVLNNPGITLNNTPFQIVSVQQASSQNILPPVPQQPNKKQQQIMQNSQVRKSLEYLH